MDIIKEFKKLLLPKRNVSHLDEKYPLPKGVHLGSGFGYIEGAYVAISILIIIKILELVILLIETETGILDKWTVIFVELMILFTIGGFYGFFYRKKLSRHYLERSLKNQK